MGVVVVVDSTFMLFFVLRCDIIASKFSLCHSVGLSSAITIVISTLKCLQLNWPFHYILLCISLDCSVMASQFIHSFPLNWMNAWLELKLNHFINNCKSSISQIENLNQPQTFRSLHTQFRFGHFKCRKGKKSNETLAQAKSMRTV